MAKYTSTVIMSTPVQARGNAEVRNLMSASPPSRGLGVAPEVEEDTGECRFGYTGTTEARVAALTPAGTQ